MSGRSAGPCTALLGTALLLTSLACAAPNAPDGGLRALETRRPAPVQRRTVPPATPAWDDSRPLRDWPSLRATFRTAEGGTLVLVRGPGLVELRRPDGSRWRWRRNPVDPRRVDAEVHHPSAAVRVGHDHSTLLSAGLPASWDAAACLGLDPLRVADREPTGAAPRIAFGHAFTPLGPGPVGDGLDLFALDWSPELGLPLALWPADAGSEPAPEPAPGTAPGTGATPALELVDLTAVGATADPPLPAALAALPLVDLADWLEEQHDG